MESASNCSSDHSNERVFQKQCIAIADRKFIIGFDRPGIAQYAPDERPDSG